MPELAEILALEKPEYAKFRSDCNQRLRREVLKARRVKGAGSPEMLARTVETQGWRPVDARLQVSDVPRIVENLGGSKLYGDDPTVALRELIQNGADAVQARRRIEDRPASWGQSPLRSRNAMTLHG